MKSLCEFVKSVSKSVNLWNLHIYDSFLYFSLKLGDSISGIYWNLWITVNLSFLTLYPTYWKSEEPILSYLSWISNVLWYSSLMKYGGVLLAYLSSEIGLQTYLRRDRLVHSQEQLLYLRRPLNPHLYWETESSGFHSLKRIILARLVSGNLRFRSVINSILRRVARNIHILTIIGRQSPHTAILSR